MTAVEDFGPVDQLPRVDTHGFRTAASPETVMATLGAILLVGFGSRRARLLARLLRCQNRAPTRPFVLESGAELAGFQVVAADPEEVVLAGQHRFSRYALVFRAGRMAEGTSVSAETKAVFPGVLGKLYRVFVISSGAHDRVMRRLMGKLKGRVEE
jgi:hypothetical protein